MSIYGLRKETALTPLKMKHIFIFLGLVLSNTCAAEAVEYRVVFTGVWTSESSDPFPSSAHFTSLIGASHGAGYSMWRTGELASKGIEDVAEEGLTRALRDEIALAQKDGLAGEIITVPSLFNLPNLSETEIQVTKKMPRISLVSMVAPSPDWFVGVSDINLRKDGRWLESLEVSMRTYDAGTEEGDGFSLDNPDTRPPESISLLGDSPFVVGSPVIAHLKFELLTELGDQEGSVTSTGTPPSTSALVSIISRLLAED